MKNDVITYTEDGPFDTFKDAIDHRNWFYGHSPDVTQCWLEKDGKISGAILMVKTK